MGDNSAEEHRAKLAALASTLADSVHVVRLELQTAIENLADLNQAGSAAGLPREDFADASAALKDARWRVAAVGRIVKAYRERLNAPAETPPGEAL